MMSDVTPDYDVIIVGAGPAGLTAGIYGLRRGLKILILEGKLPGGRIAEAHLVENYPGFPDGISGYALATKMVAQLEQMGGTITNEEVVSLSLKGEVKTVSTRRKPYTAKAVILAMGVQRRRLRIPGEKELLGKGVSYCATCDGPLFRGRRVVVVGSGDEALEEALFLSDVTSKVFLVSNDLKLNAAEYLIKRLEEKDNTQILSHHQVEAIEGQQLVESISVKDLTQTEIAKLPCNGVFIAVGYVPLTEIVGKAGVEVDQRGWIRVNREQQTNIDGVFAAGDCTGRGMQVATAVGEGTMAALSASRLVKRGTPL
jgi:thioredoxin reductase (NADPH)